MPPISSSFNPNPSTAARFSTMFGQFKLVMDDECNYVCILLFLFMFIIIIRLLNSFYCFYFSYFNIITPPLPYRFIPYYYIT